MGGLVKTTYHQSIGDVRPKRGDLVQTNVGNRRERTFIVLRVRHLANRWSDALDIEAQRTLVWAERWWEMEPAMRNALHQSAVRAGGQWVFRLQWLRPKRTKRRRVA